VVCQSALRINRGRQCCVCTSKGEEERIALRVHLATASRFHHVAQDPPLIGENVLVPLTKALEEPRRPFDVSEKEGNCPAREFGHVIGVRARDGPVNLTRPPVWLDLG
jgi:hypothetical protein